MNVPLSTFPQSPLLQTGAFVVPQTTTPQAAVTSSFQAQLQMTTPASSLLVSPLTTGALIFETLARTTPPSPPVSSPLPTFTTPRAEWLGQEDHYLQAITEQISSALASDTVPPAPEATTAPGTSTVAPPPPPGSSSPAWSLQRRGRRRRRLRLLSATFEGCLYFAAGSFLSTSGLVSFLVLVAKGGDR
jgi:hypothetical protein